jgi:hypothetical protein
VSWRAWASDARGWLAAQLAGAAPRLQGKELRGSADILSQALELRRERHNARAAALNRMPMPPRS